MPTTLFNDLVAEYKLRVDRHLDAVLPNTNSGGHQLYEAMRYSVFNGGKRVRPVLAYAAANTIGEINTATDCAAAAVEMIHAYSLIHDDLPAMDDDDLRRGKPTCHIAFDEATAILAGDALQALAFEQILSVAGTSPQLAVQLQTLLCKAAGSDGMVLGQALDIAAVDRTLEVDELERVHRHKTGAMINASILMGALTAGANSEQQAALGRYGDAIGLAFQVQDDILDVTGSTAVIGKRQGSDMALNKPTYVTLLGLEGAREKAAKLHREALRALESLGPRADQLRVIADYIVNREH
ncbi:MAG: geranyl transferase [Gammaproteobacteria bacterium]|nr:MAG: geranyl transferase [Gammaproteobacteria bacterium]